MIRVKIKLLRAKAKRDENETGKSKTVKENKPAERKKYTYVLGKLKSSNFSFWKEGAW